MNDLLLKTDKIDRLRYTYEQKNSMVDAYRVRKTGGGANLEGSHLFSSLAACHGACDLNFPVPITT